ncbi:MAG: hypothetical protein ACI84R_001106, partial [Candidatus Azotimanducaceae bacterium]
KGFDCDPPNARCAASDKDRGAFEAGVGSELGHIAISSNGNEKGRTG